MRKNPKKSLLSLAKDQKTDSLEWQKMFRQKLLYSTLLALQKKKVASPLSPSAKTKWEAEISTSPCCSEAPKPPVRVASEEVWGRVKTSVLPSNNEATSPHGVTRNHVDASDKALTPLGQQGTSRARVGRWGFEPHSAALQGVKGNSGVTWAFTTTWRSMTASPLPLTNVSEEAS